MGFTSARLAESSSMRSAWGDALLKGRALSSPVAGMSVTNSTVAGIPAFHAGVEIAAEAVAQLAGKVWKSDGAVRVPVTTGWQAQLFRGSLSPGQDPFEFWHTVQSSLDARGNAYLWKTKDGVGHVTAMTALHPDQVTEITQSSRKKLTYTVVFQDGYPVPPEVTSLGTATVGVEVILHIRGRGGMGRIVAPSPIALFATSLGIALAKSAHEEHLYANGTGHGVVVTFPATVTEEQAVVWRKVWQAEHAGPTNSGDTKVMGGGAEIKPITMTMADAQFVEGMNLSILDVSRILIIPAWLLGVSDKTTAPVSPEHEAQRWFQTGVRPRLMRLESVINADEDLFGPASSAVFGFDSSTFIRPDAETEDAIAHARIQDGRLLPDEWRVETGRAPYPGGVGSIPQIVPVGGAPNPVTPAPDSSASDDGGA